MPSNSQITLLHRLVSYVGAGYLKLVGMTSFVQKLDHPSFYVFRREHLPLIYAFWHNCQVHLAYEHRGENVRVMVSQSKDGEYIAQVMKRLDLIAIRGSSSKGAQKAFREIIHALKEGHQAAFTPDGPRGPVFSVSPGVVVASQLSGVPIIPMGSASSHEAVFNSWDRFRVPLPFGRIVTGHGKPFNLDRNAEVAAGQVKVKQALDKLQDEIQLNIAARFSWWDGLLGWSLSSLYAILSLFLIPFLAPVAIFKYGFKRTFLHLGERLTTGGLPEAEKPRLWFHAASVGEWQALRPLIKKFLDVESVSLCITVSTPEAEKLARQQEPSLPVRLLPLDLPFLMDQFVKRVKPFAVILIETELWPRLLQSCVNRAVPVLVANGRLSSKSADRWKFFKPLASRIMSQVAWFMVRSDKDGKNFCDLKASSLRMTVTGNVKSDSLKILSWEEKTKKRKELFKSQEGLWVVAGSTWPGEEEMILPLLSQDFSKKVRLILAPRRPERFKEVEQLLETHPYSWSKWSTIKSFGEWTSDILLVDTLGDLKDLYAVCDIAFIGGTLNPHGGQNPLEPAASRVPVIFGPSMENFHEEAQEFKKKGAARQVRHQADLFSDLRDLIEDDGLRRSMGEAAASVVESKQGAVDRTVLKIRELLAI